MVDELVSIVMPNYNCAEFIGRTIESIQVQTYIKWELIIMDDQSTDNVEEIVRDYMAEDKRIFLQNLKKILVRQSLGQKQ